MPESFILQSGLPPEALAKAYFLFQPSFALRATAGTRFSTLAALGENRWLGHTDSLDASRLRVSS
jgi:hypothetical protein